MKMDPAVAAVARWILSSDCQSIILLTGAGVSVSSGIPDFRSPGGMYESLRPELLTATPTQQRLMRTDPTYVVSWDIFRSNPLPYLEVRRPFILGTHQRQWKATLAHWFAALLHQKTGKLTRVYTQNIDGLDYQCCDGSGSSVDAGSNVVLPVEKIVAVHGSLAQVACEGCGAPADIDQFCKQLKSQIKDIYHPDQGPSTSTPIRCTQCQQALVKPRTVLFGRSLPERFFTASAQDLPTADLLIVAGTSLVVGPANSLVYRVPDHTKRVVINQERVGQELGLELDDDPVNAPVLFPDQHRDLWLPGDCDATFLALMQHLGWLNDLIDLAAKRLLAPSSTNVVQQAQTDAASATNGVYDPKTAS